MRQRLINGLVLALVSISIAACPSVPLQSPEATTLTPIPTETSTTAAPAAPPVVIDPSRLNSIPPGITPSYLRLVPNLMPLSRVSTQAS